MVKHSFKTFFCVPKMLFIMLDRPYTENLPRLESQFLFQDGNIQEIRKIFLKKKFILNYSLSPVKKQKTGNSMQPRIPMKQVSSQLKSMVLRYHSICLTKGLQFLMVQCSRVPICLLPARVVFAQHAGQNSLSEKWKWIPTMRLRKMNWQLVLF